MDIYAKDGGKYDRSISRYQATALFNYRLYQNLKFNI